MIGVAVRARRQHPMSSFAGLPEGRQKQDPRDRRRGGQEGRRRPRVASRATATAPVPILVDVREKDEYLEGYIPGARWIPRGFLELRIEEQVPEKSSDVVLYCAGGTRSALAARSLAELGYSNVSSMAGGFTRLEAGRAGLRPALRDDPGAVHPLRAAHHAARGGRGGAGQAAASRRCCCWAPAGWARRRASTWRRRAWARWASSTTTWSMPPTCSGRSCTPPTGSACPRSNRRRRPSTASTPT